MVSWRELREDLVILEDDQVLAVNKPAGISVMGERHATDLVRMAKEEGERLYPVHRIDKVTSGVVLFAKDLAAHGRLTRQFTKRTVDKVYLAIIPGPGLPEVGTIDLPLFTASSGRVRVAAQRESIAEAGNRWHVPPAETFSHTTIYPSVTTFATAWSDDEHAVLVVRPVSGRRHQIRVHLAWIGHAIVGDPLFDKSVAPDARTHLHSWRLGITLRDRVHIEAPPQPDFWTPLAPRIDHVHALKLATDAIERLPNPD